MAEPLAMGTDLPVHTGPGHALLTQYLTGLVNGMTYHDHPRVIYPTWEEILTDAGAAFEERKQAALVDKRLLLIHSLIESRDSKPTTGHYQVELPKPVRLTCTDSAGNRQLAPTDDTIVPTNAWGRGLYTATLVLKLSNPEWRLRLDGLTVAPEPLDRGVGGIVWGDVQEQRDKHPCIANMYLINVRRIGDIPPRESPFVSKMRKILGYPTRS